MGIRSGYILTEINNVKIENTKDLKAFEREDIFQFTFVDLNGEKEKLVFDYNQKQVFLSHHLSQRM